MQSDSMTPNDSGLGSAAPRREDGSLQVVTAAAHVVDLSRYVPAYLTWIANKLSRGASQHYLKAFGVGIETWRCLVLLAVEERVSAQRVSKVIGMDKGTVSRCFKHMQARGFIVLSLDEKDGRVRPATLTQHGREVHDRILKVALERERALLGVLSSSECLTLIEFLRRLHENLPAVEQATDRFVAQLFPQARPTGRTRHREE